MTAIALRSNNRDAGNFSAMPSNVEAEQALLGLLMMDNQAFHAIEGLTGEHFHEPLHGRLFDAIARRINAGKLAELILLANELNAAGDRAYQEMGGTVYLAQMLEAAPHPSTASAFAQEILEAARRRELIFLSIDVAGAARDPATPADDAVGLAESRLLAMQTHSRPLTLVTAAQASSRVLQYLDAPPEAQDGLLTGLQPLDSHIGGLHPGDLVLVMGRPSMGKSALAGCFALNMATAGRGVIELNGEMTAEQMMRRHLTDLTQARWGSKGPKYSDIRRREISADQRRMLTWADEQIQPLPLLLLKRAGLKLSQVRSIARRQAAAWARRGSSLGTVVIDHVGLVKPDQPSRDRYADQTAISNGLKELAEELGCPLIALNQMNRDNEKRDDKRPQLSDLRDSGSWEQDADFVIGCYREAYYAQRQPEPKKDLEWAEWDRARKSQVIEAIILKAREGESTTIKLWGDVARNAIRGAEPEGDLI
jgi:replicative DNA helicase